MEGLKDHLATLALTVLGQHLWSLRVDLVLAVDSKSVPSACLCPLCDLARRNFTVATGTGPTREQEQDAMNRWGAGETIISPTPTKSR